MRALKITLLGGLVLVVVIGALLLAIPYFVNVDSYGAKIVQQAEASIGRKITVGEIKLSLLPLAVRIKKLGVSEDPAFGSGDFATMDELRVEVGLMPLLNRQVEVGLLEAVNPSVKLVKNAKGVWNIDSLSKGGGKVTPDKPAGGAAGGALQVSKLRLKDGTVSTEDRSGPKPVNRTFDHLNMTVENLADGKPFDFLLALKVGGAKAGDIEMSGTAGPLRPGTPPMLPVKAHVKLDEVDLGSFSDPKTPITGLLSGTIEIDSDGRLAKVEGETKVEKLHASPKGHPAAIPVTSKFSMEYAPATEVLTVKSLVAAVGKSNASLSGTINQKDPSRTRINLKADKAALAEIGQLLPALGVVLPNNSSFASGVLTNSGDFHGSLQPLNGTASLNVQNAKLSGFSVAEKVAAVARFAGISAGRDTEITSLKGNVNFVQGAATFANVELIMPGLTVTGGGTMSADGQLDMKLTAALTGAAAGAQVLKLVSGTKGVPFFVRGTADNPVFVPDVAGMASGLASQQLTNRLPGVAGATGGNLGKVLGGLFGKKP